MGNADSLRSGPARLLRVPERKSRPSPRRRGQRPPARRRPPGAYDPGAPLTEEDLKTRPWEEFLVEQLREDPRFAAGFLDDAAASGDVRLLMMALRSVVEAHGGIGELARKTKLSRTTLYKTLSRLGNPGLDTFETILGVYNLRMTFQPVVAERRGRYRAKRRR